jgi:hypothetical protein
VHCPPPQATVTVVGDAALQTALSAHIQDFGAAVNTTIALKDPIYALAAKSVDVFKGIGEVTAAGVTCFTASLQTAVNAKASIDVSVSASASVTTK